MTLQGSSRRPALGGRRLRIRGRIIIPAADSGVALGKESGTSANGYGLASRRSEKEDLDTVIMCLRAVCAGWWWWRTRRCGESECASEDMNLEKVLISVEVSE